MNDANAAQVQYQIGVRWKTEVPAFCRSARRLIVNWCGSLRTGAEFLARDDTARLEIYGQPAAHS